MPTQRNLWQIVNDESFFSISPLDFEKCCKQLLELTGRFRHVEVTKKGPKGGDGGVDLLMYAPDGKVFAYGQCKQWQTRFKGFLGSINALRRSMNQGRVSRGFLFVTTEVTYLEKREAKICNIEIFDIYCLKRMLAELCGPRSQKMNAKQNYNFLKYRTGRPATDLVTDVRGQMNTCVECNVEYLVEEAFDKKWYLYEGHCKKCGTEKYINMIPALS